MIPEAAKGAATVTVQKSKGAATETPMKGVTNRNVSLNPSHVSHQIKSSQRSTTHGFLNSGIQRNVKMYFILLLGIVNKIRIWSFF